MDPIHIKPTWHEISLRQVAFAHKFYSTLMQRRRKLFPLAPGKKLHNLNNACKITSGELEIIGKSRDFLRHKQIYISVIKGTL